MAMMGPAVGRQDRLFYEFDLEERIPHDHLLRRIDAVLDVSWLRARAPFYSHTGCPSIDPELMIRMLLIGYCYSIRSERRLCREVELNLAYRWFCGLGLEAAVPHHSTFSVNRHGRFRESAAFRLVFESVVVTCMKVGLVGGEGFAVDASVVEADASRYQRVEGSDVDWSDEQKAQRPVREYLAALESENSPVNPGEDLVQPDRLRARILLWAEEEIRLGHLPPKAGAVIRGYARSPSLLPFFRARGEPAVGLPERGQHSGWHRRLRTSLEPPGRFAYLAVDDVDARVKQATAAGAQLMRPIFDVRASAASRY